MYSVETKVLTVTWKQYLYKFKSFSFVGLIIMQLIVLVLSSSGTMMSGSSSGNLFISVKTYSSDIVIICTLIWIFVMAISLSKRGSKNMDFTLVTNRLSSSLSDVALLVTLSVLGGLTASLSGFLLRFIMYFTVDSSMMISSSLKLPLPVLLQGITVAVLYLFLVSAVAYLFGILVEVNKLLAFIIPALLFGLARVQNEVLANLVQFFTRETLLYAFTGKVILTAGLLFALSIIIYNRMEVRG